MNVIQYIGLDVHNESIAVSLAPSDSTEVRRWGILAGLKRRRRAAAVAPKRRYGAPQRRKDCPPCRTKRENFSSCLCVFVAKSHRRASAHLLCRPHQRRDDFWRRNIVQAFAHDAHK